MRGGVNSVYDASVDAVDGAGGIMFSGCPSVCAYECTVRAFMRLCMRPRRKPRLLVVYALCFSQGWGPRGLSLTSRTIISDLGPALKVLSLITSLVLVILRIVVKVQ